MFAFYQNGLLFFGKDTYPCTYARLHDNVWKTVVKPQAIYLTILSVSLIHVERRSKNISSTRWRWMVCPGTWLSARTTSAHWWWLGRPQDQFVCPGEEQNRPFPVADSRLSNTSELLTLFLRHIRISTPPKNRSRNNSEMKLLQLVITADRPKMSTNKCAETKNYAPPPLSLSIAEQNFIICFCRGQTRKINVWFYPSHECRSTN